MPEKKPTHDKTDSKARRDDDVKTEDLRPDAVEAAKTNEAPAPEPVPEGHIARAEVVRMIDEILHDDTYTDAEGRRRLALLSKRLTQK